ncbi:MAG: oligosaccharide flippase family protein [Rhodobacteraceae bacterium]|nr:polysaccharide biosynthesis protein [Salipiger sp.]NVK62597.1 oligosaccharide flippase family protein [Paracoccaceae bacterium]
MSETRKNLLGHLLAYGASEMASKLSRLGVVIAVARTLEASEIGIAAAAIATGDMLKALTENGVIQRIIAARDEELDATCNRAHGLFWAWCLGLFGVQAAVATGVWALTGNVPLALLILVLSGEYLFMPGGLVQAGLALRNGKLRQTAAIAGGQAVLANGLSVVLALLWPSALALILPRLLTAPFWLVAMRRLNPWVRNPEAGKTPIRPFLNFGWAVLGVEVVKAARMQADKLIVGALLGPQALGLYFMAFNAGLSLATSFSTAFAAVLFPHLCASEDRAAALRQGMAVSLGLVGPAVILQALLAPWYVPILLGDGWADLSATVSVLCLAAIPTMLWTAAAGWMRAENRPQHELLGTALLTGALMLNTILAAPYGLETIAWGYLATASVTMLVMSWPALRFALVPTLAKA